MLKFSVKTHKNFLNPEYHDTKPSCNFFFSHSRPICTKNMAVTSPVTASVLSLAVSTWTAKRGLYDLQEQRCLYLRGAGKPHSQGGELQRGYGKEIHQFHDKRGHPQKTKYNNYKLGDKND